MMNVKQNTSAMVGGFTHDDRVSWVCLHTRRERAWVYVYARKMQFFTVFLAVHERLLKGFSSASREGFSLKGLSRLADKIKRIVPFVSCRVYTEE